MLQCEASLALVTMDANYSPDGVLGLQAEEEALSEGLDIVHTEEVVRRHIRCQVSCTHQQLLQFICCLVILNSRLAYTGKHIALYYKRRF